MPDWPLRLESLGLSLGGEDPPRTKSFLTTLFGDVVAVHGGAAGLAGLIRFCAGFGASERGVRIAVHRMAREGWLVGERSGRAGHYRLSDDGRERFAAASERIYAPRPRGSPGRWQIVIAPDLTAAQRNTLRREMRWLGFVGVGGRTLLHAGGDRAETARVLREIGLDGRVCVFDAACDDPGDPGRLAPLRRLASVGWDLEKVRRRHLDFLGTFAPLLGRLGAGAAPSAGDALRARVLLVHEFRRALLPDPDLPAALLPGRWSGHRARDLCARLYLLLAPASEPAARRAFQAPGRESLPPADGAFWRRFGGTGAPAAVPARGGAA